MYPLDIRFVMRERFIFIVFRLCRAALHWGEDSIPHFDVLWNPSLGVPNQVCSFRANSTLANVAELEERISILHVEKRVRGQ